MEKEHEIGKTVEESDLESLAKKPQNQWRIAIKGMKNEISDRWLPDITMTIFAGTIGAYIGNKMNTQRGMIFGAAIGITFVIWVIAFMMLRHIPLDEKQTEPKQEKIAEPITPSIKEPDLQDPTFAPGVEEMTVFFGGFGVKFNPKASGTKIFDIAGFVPIRLHAEEDKLFADVTIYGGEGKPLIEITNNRFIVRPHNWDRNSSNAALEIVDEKQRPILQLIYEKPTQIRINGYLPGPKGILLVGAGNKTYSNPGPEELAAISLKPIFKYPSWKYPGQYAD
jgi:hypothetical protein